MEKTLTECYTHKQMFNFLQVINEAVKESNNLYRILERVDKKKQTDGLMIPTGYNVNIQIINDNGSKHLHNLCKAERGDTPIIDVYIDSLKKIKTFIYELEEFDILDVPEEITDASEELTELLTELTQIKENQNLFG